MTPDPPYGADLPRPPESWRFRSDATAAYALDCTTALDAANAEVLALRRVVEEVREECGYGLAREMYGRGNRGTDLTARNVLALLPAPTEGDGRG